jgi:hypothetical protein
MSDVRSYLPKTEKSEEGRSRHLHQELNWVVEEGRQDMAGEASRHHGWAGGG